MKIKDLPTWPPHSEGRSGPPPERLGEALMQNPRRMPRGVQWTAKTPGRVDTVQLRLLNPLLLDRLWPVFVEMDGQSLRVIGERDIPERQAQIVATVAPAAPVSPPRLAGVGPTRRSSLSSPTRRRPLYGDFDNEGHGDGNVG